LEQVVEEAAVLVTPELLNVVVVAEVAVRWRMVFTMPSLSQPH